MKKEIILHILSCCLFVFSMQLQSDNQALSVTEQINKASLYLDKLSALEIVQLMNTEDHYIAPAIRPWIDNIAQGVEAIVKSLESGGRLVYVGAGSSGRLGVLDASECVPTFSAPKKQIVGIIAGGDAALRTSIESVEDMAEQGIQDLKNILVQPNDVVCGISASGSAEYVASALRYARDIGCFTIALTCNAKNKIKDVVNCFIAPEVGPEILAGSTRLKSGTATKMVLNMLTTAAYVRLGKVYKNLMIDLLPVNKKLILRSKRILKTLFNIDDTYAQALLKQSHGNIKIAIIMHLFALDYPTAHTLLQQNNGHLRNTIDSHKRH